MTEEERQKKREYLQKYREVNRQKINEYALNWKYNQSKEGAEKRKQWQREYYQKNKAVIIDKIKGKWAAMTQEEKDKYNEKKRQRYKIWYFLLDDDKKRKLIDVSRKWIDNNKELHAEMNKQYYQQNKKKKDESGKVPTTQPG
jgi:hypothetical protein